MTSQVGDFVGKIVLMFTKLAIEFPSSFCFNSIDNIGQSERDV